jgi:hypothetical protein
MYRRLASGDWRDRSRVLLDIELHGRSMTIGGRVSHVNWVGDVGGAGSSFLTGECERSAFMPKVSTVRRPSSC